MDTTLTSTAAAKKTDDTAQTTMRVTKRNGHHEPVDINKIVRAIDRWLYTRVDFEDEIKAGNVAAAIYKSALLLFVAVVIATVMS